MNMATQTIPINGTRNLSVTSAYRPIVSSEGGLTGEAYVLTFTGSKNQT